jgi:hypothetical protein
VLFADEPHPLSNDGRVELAVGAAAAGVGSDAPQTSEEPHGSNPEEAVVATGLGTAAGLILADKLKGEGTGGAVDVADGIGIEVKADGAVVVVGGGVERSKRSADMLDVGLD